MTKFIMKKFDYKILLRLSVSAIIFFSTIFIIKFILHIPTVHQFFSPEVLTGKKLIVSFIILWTVIFLECGIIPGSYIPFIVFANGTAMATDKIFYLLLITSAVALGRVIAYFVGQKVGSKLLKWSAGKEEIYEKWCTELNKPAGKWIYAFTVASPCFPDFIIALVAGSLKINFTFYMITNVLCKFVENAVLIFI